MPTDTDDSRAPADRIQHPRWPRWKIIVAYATLAAIALFSIWYINQRVDHRPKRATTAGATRPVPSCDQFGKGRLWPITFFLS